jgi:5-methylcytosine-specific restriction endonuclease McrA
MRNRIDRTCEYCGAEFVTIPRQIKLGGAKYCSNECRYLANRGSGHSSWRGGTVGYRGENWLQQRHLAWERDKGICQHCGKKPAKGKKRFDVHHIKPFREFGGDYVTANQLINLITLCPTCHKLAEHRIISIQPYLF